MEFIYFHGVINKALTLLRNAFTACVYVCAQIILVCILHIQSFHVAIPLSYYLICLSFLQILT